MFVNGGWSEGSDGLVKSLLPSGAPFSPFFGVWVPLKTTKMAPLFPMAAGHLSGGHNGLVLWGFGFRTLDPGEEPTNPIRRFLFRERGLWRSST